MKKFVHGTLATAVVVALSSAAQADTYSVTELPKPENLVNTSPTAINNAGYIAALGRLPTDIEINFDWISSQTRASLGIPPDTEDEEFTSDDLVLLQYYSLIPQLEDQYSGNLGNQRIGMTRAIAYDGTNTVFEFFDDNDANTEELENTVDSFLYNVNDNGVYVGYGTAPYRPYEYSYQGRGDQEDETFTITRFERDFISRAVWQANGTIKVVEPPEQGELGGESAFMDINENNLAVGYASIGISPASAGAIETCYERAEEPDEPTPAAACIWSAWQSRKNARVNNIRESFFDPTIVRGNNSIYDINAFLWQLDANGNVISQTQLGTLMARDEEEDNLDFSSYAYAVNNNDIAVGQSWTYLEQTPARENRVKMPVVFRNGEVEAITTDETYRWGSANDINDNNRVVGYLKRTIQSYTRDVGFFYDLDAAEPEVIEVPSFFVGSSTVLSAINNQGMAVGSAEVDPGSSSERRRVGVVIDTTAEQMELIDLNDTISCSADYFIVAANDINDNGQIVATAVYTEDVTEEDGRTFDSIQSRTLLLDPIEGELNDCQAESTRTERVGASMNLISLFGMFLIGGLITIRRRYA